MFERVKKAIFPHFIGLMMMVSGWLLSIGSVGIRRFEPDILFTRTTASGLLLILAGAYFPDIYLRIRKIFKK